ncbi:MAG: CocE/NonD family hydrolase C-terminal non-catalytic domain-containing protein [Thermoleophilaceae bacterium]
MSGGSRKGLRLLVALFALAAAFTCAGTAQASIAQLKGACAKKDALDDNTANGSTLPITFCDDGTPSTGGRDANAGADKAIAVPAAYAGALRLPAKDAAAAAAVSGNSGGDIALDADLTLPDPGLNPMPAGGYPLIVFTHGCCGGDRHGWEAATIDGGTSAEKWHHSNAWFAARGYAVLTYTSRGFVNGQGDGSTGEMHLQSTRFEINDYQHLAGELADQADVDSRSPGAQRINPQKIVPVGGSYSGGFAWLALTDPDWTSPGGRQMRVAAVAAKYGWTNVLESLVPSGSDRRDSLPTTSRERAEKTFGFAKRSINAGLFATGLGVVPNSSHTTFPAEIVEAEACLNVLDPYESSPLCANTLSGLVPRLIADSSAYYQNSFFAGLSGRTISPVPVFSVGTFTDPLFPTSEHRRMAERLKASVPGYPIQEYYGDLQHFSQNKRKDWSDLCGADHHVCRYADYPAAPGGRRNLNAVPASRVREAGINSRINRFLDHYVAPPSNPAQPKPANDVTASLQICPDNTSAAYPLDEPGKRFTAGTFAGLAPNRLTITADGPEQLLPNKALPNLNSINADPVVNQIRNSNRCAVQSKANSAPSAGPGVATYDSAALPRNYTLLGQPRLGVTHSAAGTPAQLNARVYDLHPDGRQVLVTRTAYRLTPADVQAGRTTLDLRGAGWTFPRGHRVRLELSQDDEPHIKASIVPSLLTLSGAKLELPVREPSASLAGASRPSGVGVELNTRAH